MANPTPQPSRLSRSQFAGVWLAVALALAGFVMAAGGIGPGLAVDASLNRLVDRQRTANDDAASDSYLVGWQATGPLTHQQLRQIDAAGKTLRGLPQVRTVTGLPQATLPRVEADGVLTVRSIASVARDAPDAGTDTAVSAANHPLTRGRLIAPDATLATAVVRVRAGHDPLSVADALRRNAAVPGLSVAVTGTALMQAAASEALERQIKLIAPLAAVLVVILLALAWRSVRAVMWPLTTIVVALGWTLAFMTLAGVALTLVTAIVPVLVLTLGLAYAMHLLSAIEREGSALAARRHLSRPIWLTALTTMAGLGALALSPLTAIREFTVAACAGTLAVALATTWVLPLLCQSGDLGRYRLHPMLARPLDRISDTVGAICLRHSALILVGALAFVAIMVVGALRIDTRLDLSAGVPADTPAARDHRALNTALGGVNTLTITITAPTADGLLQGETLRALELLDGWLARQPGVGARTSFLDYARITHDAFADQRGGALPTGAALKQLLVFAAPDALYDTIDHRFKQATWSLTTPLSDTASLHELVTGIRDYLRALPAPLTSTLDGAGLDVVATMTELAPVQGASLVLAFVAMFTLLSLVFASPRVGLLTMLPNVLPVAAYFGLMGWLDIALGPATSLVACIVLGIAVDDTLHYLLRFNDQARATADEQTAAVNALHEVIRPITLTTLAVVAGFLTLTVSDLPQQVEFGALAAATLVIAWISDITVTPALGSQARVVTQWDALRLNLGANPLHEIPLLAGLTLRQARTFALMMTQVDAPAGTRIIHEGDDTGEVFVIVEGQVRVSRDASPDDAPIAVFGRGTLVGEVGLFGERRTADVTTIGMTQLIRFTPEDIDRLMDRYPRIAARVLLNLNAIQAQRRAVSGSAGVIRTERRRFNI